jgi:hypothetical protein
MNSEDLRPGDFVLAPKGDTLVVAKVFEVQTGRFASNKPITVEINGHRHAFAIDELAPIPATKSTLIALFDAEIISNFKLKIGTEEVFYQDRCWNLPFPTLGGSKPFKYIHELQRLVTL